MAQQSQKCKWNTHFLISSTPASTLYRNSPIELTRWRSRYIKLRRCEVEEKMSAEVIIELMPSSSSNETILGQMDVIFLFYCFLFLTNFGRRNETQRKRFVEDGRKCWWKSIMIQFGKVVFHFLLRFINRIRKMTEESESNWDEKRKRARNMKERERDKTLDEKIEAKRVLSYSGQANPESGGRNWNEQLSSGERDSDGGFTFEGTTKMQTMMTKSETTTWFAICTLSGERADEKDGRDTSGTWGATATDRSDERNGKWTMLRRCMRCASS